MFWINGNGFTGLNFMGFTFFAQGRTRAELFALAKNFIQRQQRAGQIWEECRHGH